MKKFPVKKSVVLAVLLVMALLLSSCSLIVRDELKDAQSVILKLGDEVVTKAEVQTAADNYLYEMYSYYNTYGVDLDVTDPEVIASAQSASIKGLKQDMVLRAKAKELGLDVLNEEETAHANEHAQENLDYAKSYIQSTLLTEEEQALEGEELDKVIDSYLEKFGVSIETYEKNAVDEVIDEKIKDYILKDVTVPDEDVKADYDSKVAADEEKYKEDAPAWVSEALNGTVMYYTPAGVRRVKQILLKFKEEDNAAISEATAKVSDAGSKLTEAQARIAEAESTANSEEASQEEKDAAAADLAAAQADLEAAQAELDAAQAELDAAKDAAFANLDEDADAILSALAEDPDSWDQLMEEKNEDTGLQAGSQNAEKGYPICKDMTGFDTVFVDAAMALENVGDVSDKIRGTSYGYYIIKYMSDEAEGPVDYDSVKDSISSSLLSAKQDEVYDQTVEQWIAEAGVKEDLGALND